MYFDFISLSHWCPFAARSHLDAAGRWILPEREAEGIRRKESHEASVRGTLLLGILVAVRLHVLAVAVVFLVASLFSLSFSLLVLRLLRPSPSWLVGWLACQNETGPGQPAELAPAYVFLASSDSSYTTGEVLGVTGGGILA
jgi:hypothetical protein